MRLCGDISVDRGEKSSRGQSLNDMRERLERGDSLLIFPEGTRQTDPNQPLGDFRDGAFNLASQTGIPIVALVMKDTGSIWKKEVSCSTFNHSNTQSLSQSPQQIGKLKS